MTPDELETLVSAIETRVALAREQCSTPNPFIDLRCGHADALCRIARQHAELRRKLAELVAKPSWVTQSGRKAVFVPDIEALLSAGSEG